MLVLGWPPGQPHSLAEAYQYAFYVPAATLFGIWILFRLLQTNRPEDVGLPPIEQYRNEKEAIIEEGESPEEEPEGSWKVVYEVITTPMVILLAVVYFFLKPTRYAILFWGPLYVNEELGTGMAESGALSAMFELAGPVSIFLTGVVSDKLFRARRIPICVIGLLLLSVAVFSLEKIPEGKLELGACLFVVGFCLFGPDAMISGTASVDFGTKKGASTAAGLINGCGSVGAVIGGTVPGFFKEEWGWDGVFTFLANCPLIAGLLLIPCWNAMPKTVEQKNGQGEVKQT